MIHLNVYYMVCSASDDLIVPTQKCPMCLQVKPAVRSHLIPAALYASALQKEKARSGWEAAWSCPRTVKRGPISSAKNARTFSTAVEKCGRYRNCHNRWGIPTV